MGSSGDEIPKEAWPSLLFIVSLIAYASKMHIIGLLLVLVASLLGIAWSIFLDEERLLRHLVLSVVLGSAPLTMSGVMPAWAGFLFVGSVVGGLVLRVLV